MTNQAPDDDALYQAAVRHVRASNRASISSVQGALKIGYQQAARLMDAMEAQGVVTPIRLNGLREVVR